MISNFSEKLVKNRNKFSTIKEIMMISSTASGLFFVFITSASYFLLFLYSIKNGILVTDITDKLGTSHLLIFSWITISFFMIFFTVYMPRILIDTNKKITRRSLLLNKLTKSKNKIIIPILFYLPFCHIGIYASLFIASYFNYKLNNYNKSSIFLSTILLVIPSIIVFYLYKKSKKTINRYNIDKTIITISNALSFFSISYIFIIIIKIMAIDASDGLNEIIKHYQIYDFIRTETILAGLVSTTMLISIIISVFFSTPISPNAPATAAFIATGITFFVIFIYPGANAMTSSALRVAQIGGGLSITVAAPDTIACTPQYRRLFTSRPPQSAEPKSEAKDSCRSPLTGKYVSVTRNLVLDGKTHLFFKIDKTVIGFPKKDEILIARTVR